MFKVKLFCVLVAFLPLYAGSLLFIRHRFTEEYESSIRTLLS